MIVRVNVLGLRRRLSGLSLVIEAGVGAMGVVAEGCLPGAEVDGVVGLWMRLQTLILMSKSRVRLLVAVVTSR